MDVGELNNFLPAARILRVLGIYTTCYPRCILNYNLTPIADEPVDAWHYDDSESDDSYGESEEVFDPETEPRADGRGGR